jgi:hypothetical protein
MRFVQSQRLKWLGHVERMPKEREVTRIYIWKPLASRPEGRPKNRWENDVRADLQKMKIKNWKGNVLDRDSWRTIVERTKTHKELYVDGRIILRWIFRKWEGVVGTGWSGLRIGTGGGHL